MMEYLLLISLFCNPLGLIEAQTNMIDTLQELIKKGDKAAISALINQYPNVLDEQDENGTTGFIMLAYGGLNSAFNQATNLKKTFSFFESIIIGKTDLIRDAMQNDTDIVNTISPDGFPALTLACFFGQTNITELLLSNGANPNLRATNPSKVYALHSAVAAQNIEICKLLLDHGADVNAVQMQQVTALHAATHRGHLEMVKLLVHHGADLEAKMENGDSARLIAEREGHKAVLAYINSI